MSHTYLLDTYKFLQRRLDELQQKLTDKEADQYARLYSAGQIEAVCETERFLKAHFDIKLPRRLRTQTTSKNLNE